jgi:CheY-like chemotaxis protein
MQNQEWRILVIEDESDSREMLHDILVFHGIDAVTVPTAEDALRVLQDITPHLIVIDLALPGMDGWELLSELRDDPTLAHIPRVALTAFHSASVAQHAITAGFNAYFSKPIDANNFVDELLAILAT